MLMRAIITTVKKKFFRSGQRTDYQITSNRGLWDQVWIRYEKLGAIIK